MRILVADDHDLVRDTIAAFLTYEIPAEVATAATLDDAIKVAVASDPFDLILLDYTMPGMDGLNGLHRVMDRWPDTPVAILSGTASSEIAEQCIAAGAAGFVPKTLPSRDMVGAARRMAEGKAFLPGEMRTPEGEDAIPALSRREAQVLRGICDGKSNKEIALDHGLQEVTVKLHVSTLCRKLGARNRTHAAMIARDMRMV